MVLAWGLQKGSCPQFCSKGTLVSADLWGPQILLFIYSQNFLRWEGKIMMLRGSWNRFKSEINESQVAFKWKWTCFLLWRQSRRWKGWWCGAGPSQTDRNSIGEDPGDPAKTLGNTSLSPGSSRMMRLYTPSLSKASVASQVSNGSLLNPWPPNFWKSCSNASHIHPKASFSFYQPETWSLSLPLAVPVFLHRQKGRKKAILNNFQSATHYLISLHRFHSC